ERTTVTRGDTDPTVRERTITQVIQGEAQVRYVPQAVDYYSYSATFWRKTRPALFGVYVQPLDEATRRQLQSNRGVIVKIVVNRSPAFDADILRGDIITRFAGEPVADPADLFAKIKRLAGREVTVTLVRNSAAREITVRLRDGN
ncbi:MAG TPA: S1C family serine protease, partial [bacterium]|nr:S1C family serine protease [bacterium]